MISHVVDCPIANRRIVAMHGDDVLISPNSGPISLANDEGDIPVAGGLTAVTDPTRRGSTVDLLREEVGGFAVGFYRLELCES